MCFFWWGSLDSMVNWQRSKWCHLVTLGLYFCFFLFSGLREKKWSLRYFHFALHSGLRPSSSHETTQSNNLGAGSPTQKMALPLSKQISFAFSSFSTNGLFSHLLNHLQTGFCPENSYLNPCSTWWGRHYLTPLQGQLELQLSNLLHKQAANFYTPYP